MNREVEEDQTLDVEEDDFVEAIKYSGWPQSVITSTTPGASNEYRSSMQSWLDGLGVEHFKASEVGFLGGKHHISGHECEGLNEPANEDLWANMEQTIVVLEKFRVHLGVPMRINSAFRNQPYNKCVGGRSGSLHKNFNAIDFTTSAMDPRELALNLRKFRDDDEFVGGIGVYNTFVHIDTRGENKNFKGKTTPQADFDYVFG